jgi:hypothetical protein
VLILSGQLRHACVWVREHVAETSEHLSLYIHKCFAYSLLLLACVTIPPIQVPCDALLRYGLSYGLGLFVIFLIQYFISARFINTSMDFIIKNGD